MIFFILFSLISLDEALLNLQKARGEIPAKKIQVEIIDKDKLEKYVNEAIRETYGDQIEDFERILSFFNLIEKDKKYKEEAISLYKEQAAAFYNPKDFTLKVMEGISQDNIFLQMALIHELMHALQDEKIKIYNEMQKRKRSYDSLMALQSFLEGEAILVPLISLADININNEEEFSILKDNLTSLTENFEAFNIIENNFITYEMLFPYKWGSDFVLYNLEKGKWKRIDEIYKMPPCTMEEILHYNNNVSPPKDLLKISKKINFNGYKRGFSTSFGESVIYYIFSKHNSKEEAKKNAEGWDGDQLTLFKKNGQNIILWLFHWDTENDLKEALEGFKTFVKSEKLNLIPFVSKKSLALLFYKDEKPEISSRIFDIINKMEEQNVYECKSK